MRRARLRIGRRGAASLELALLAPLLATLVVGAFDFGRHGLALARATSAAEAGVQYALQSPGNAADVGAIAVAAQTDAGLSAADLGVAARTYCTCPGAGGEVGCAAACSDGGYTLRHLEVSVERAFVPLFDYPGLAGARTIVATRTARLR